MKNKITDERLDKMLSELYGQDTSCTFRVKAKESQRQKHRNIGVVLTAGICLAAVLSVGIFAIFDRESTSKASSPAISTVNYDKSFVIKANSKPLSEDSFTTVSDTVHLQGGVGVGSDEDYICVISTAILFEVEGEDIETLTFSGGGYCTLYDYDEDGNKVELKDVTVPYSLINAESNAVVDNKSDTKPQTYGVLGESYEEAMGYNSYPYIKVQIGIPSDFENDENTDSETKTAVNNYLNFLEKITEDEDAMDFDEAFNLSDNLYNAMLKNARLTVTASFKNGTTAARTVVFSHTLERNITKPFGDAELTAKLRF